jgi:hypothetical protein
MMMVLRKTPVFWLIIGLVFLLTTAMGVESGGKRHTFEVRNSITSPQYRSDAARAIDAYERLMERYMSLTETNLVAAQADGRDMAYRLTRLESTLERIEQKLDHLSRTLQGSPLPGPIPTQQHPNAATSP